MKKRTSLSPLLVFLPLMLLCFCCTFAFGSVIYVGQQGAEYTKSLPADEVTGIRSWARIYWLGAGMFEANIETSDTTPGEVYEDWSLKLVVVGENVTLRDHFHESESSVGPLYLNKDLSSQGTYVFEPFFPEYLFLPWIEHNFAFSGIEVGPEMNMKMYLVLHLPEGDREIPIHIPALETTAE